MNDPCDQEIMNAVVKKALTNREKEALDRFGRITHDFGLSKREVMALIAGYERGKNKGFDLFAEKLNTYLPLPPGKKDDEPIYSLKGIIHKIELVKKELVAAP